MYNKNNNMIRYNRKKMININEIFDILAIEYIYIYTPLNLIVGNIKTVLHVFFLNMAVDEFSLAIGILDGKQLFYRNLMRFQSGIGF